MNSKTETPPPQVGDTWFRYEDRVTGYVDEHSDRFITTGVELVQHKFNVIKVTPKGVWLRVAGSYGGLLPPRFVLLAARKRYAAPTVALALQSLRARRLRQIGLLQARMARAQRTVALTDHTLALTHVTEDTPCGTT